MTAISPPDRAALLPRVQGLLEVARAACGVPGVGLDLIDRPAVAYAGIDAAEDPAARTTTPRISVDVCDRDDVRRGRLVAYDAPELAGRPLEEGPARHLAATAGALGDLLSIEALAAHERELTSAVNLTEKAGRKREQREDRVRRQVGALFRGHVGSLRSAIDEAVSPDVDADASGGWHGPARRAGGLQRAAAWAEELERLLDDVAVAREGLDEPDAAAHRLEDLVDAALDRMSQLGQRLGAADGPRVVSVRDALLAVDGEAVQRALQHLLAAALTSEPAEDRAEHVEVEAWHDGDRIVVSVQDDGSPDRAEELRTRLARGFGGTDADDAGLAIGVVDAVARAHGGRCWIERSEMGGVQVNMSLPAATGELGVRRVRGAYEGAAEESARRHRHPSETVDAEAPLSPGAEQAPPRSESPRPAGETPDNVRGLFEKR